MNWFLNLHSNMVLLKWDIRMSRFKFRIIYIPIWYYLNKHHVRYTYHWFYIYIPIWYYLNLSLNLQASSRNTNLHSNMVLLKWSLLHQTLYHSKYLHSNMVLLKYFLQMLGKDTLTNLHSNMVLLKYMEHLKK